VVGGVDWVVVGGLGCFGAGYLEGAPCVSGGGAIFLVPVGPAVRATPKTQIHQPGLPLFRCWRGRLGLRRHPWGGRGGGGVFGFGTLVRSVVFWVGGGVRCWDGRATSARGGACFCGVGGGRGWVGGGVGAGEFGVGGGGVGVGALVFFPAALFSCVRLCRPPS